MQACIIFFLKVSVDLGRKLVDTCLIDHALLNKAIRVHLGRCFAASDIFVHKRLRKTRLINFVVALESVANHIDKNIFLELLPVGNHQLGDANHSFRVGCVDTQNRHSKRLHNVRSVFETAIVFRIRGEADLVVRNNVERTVTGELG